MNILRTLAEFFVGAPAAVQAALANTPAAIEKVIVNTPATLHAIVVNVSTPLMGSVFVLGLALGYGAFRVIRAAHRSPNRWVQAGLYAAALFLGSASLFASADGMFLGLPIAPTTQWLLQMSSQQYLGVLRTGYYNRGDVSPLEYIPSPTTCVNHATLTVTASGFAMTASAGTVSSNPPLNGFVIDATGNIPPGTRALSVPPTGAVGMWKLNASVSVASPITVTVVGDGGSQIPSADGGCFYAYEPGSTGHPPAVNTFPGGTIDPAQFGTVADFNATSPGDLEHVITTGSTYDSATGTVTLCLSGTLTLTNNTFAVQGLFGGGTTNYTGGTSTGSANAQVVSSLSPSGFTLAAGKAITFTPGFSNTGATQLNANSTGLTTIDKVSGGSLVALTGGELTANLPITVVYNGSVFVIPPWSTLGGDRSPGGSVVNACPGTNTPSITYLSGLTGLGNITFSGGVVSSGGVQTTASGTTLILPSTSVPATLTVGDGITVPNAGANYYPYASTVTSVGTSSGGFTPIGVADPFQETLGITAATNTSGNGVRVTFGTDNLAMFNAALAVGLPVKACTGRYYHTGTIAMLTPGGSFTGCSSNATGAGTDFEPAGDGASPEFLFANGSNQDIGNFNVAANNRIGTLGIHYQVLTATVVSGGTGGGSAGPVTIQGTLGNGVKFQATGTINGSGHLTGPLTVAYNTGGDYTTLPPSLSAEPVVGISAGNTGLTGATVALTTGILEYFNDDGVIIQSVNHTGTHFHQINMSQAFGGFLGDTSNTETFEDMSFTNIAGHYGIKLQGSILPDPTSSPDARVVTLTWGSANNGQIEIVCTDLITSAPLPCFAGGKGDYVKLTFTNANASGPVPSGPSSFSSKLFQVLSVTSEYDFFVAAPGPNGYYGNSLNTVAPVLGPSGGYQVFIARGNMETGGGLTTTKTAGQPTTSGNVLNGIYDTDDVFPGMFAVDVTNPSALPQPAMVTGVAPNAQVALSGNIQSAVALGDSIKFVPFVHGFWAATNANSIQEDVQHAQGNCGAAFIFDPTWLKSSNEWQAQRIGGDNQFCGDLIDINGIAIRLQSVYINVHADLGAGVLYNGAGVYMGPGAWGLVLPQTYIQGVWGDGIELHGQGEINIVAPNLGALSDIDNGLTRSGIHAYADMLGRVSLVGGNIGLINQVYSGGQFALRNDTGDPTQFIANGVQVYGNTLGAYDDASHFANVPEANTACANPSNVGQTIPPLDPRTRYYLCNLNLTYSAAHITAIDTAIRALVSNNLWNKIDQIYFGIGNVHDSSVNARYPGPLLQPPAIVPPTATINFTTPSSGVGGMQSASGQSTYIDTGVPIGAMPNCTPTSCAMLVYPTTNLCADNTYDMAMTGTFGAASAIVACNGSNNLQTRAFSTSTFQDTVTTTAKTLTGWVLTGGTASTYGTNTTWGLLGTHSVTAATPSSGDLTLMGFGTCTSPTVCSNNARKDAGFVEGSGSMTLTDVTNLKGIFDTLIGGW